MGAPFSYVIYNYNMLPECQTSRNKNRSSSSGLIQIQITEEYELQLFSTSSLYLKLIWNIVEGRTKGRTGDESKHENPANILNSSVRWVGPTQANLGREG